MFVCSIDTVVSLAKSRWQGSTIFSVFSYCWVHFSFKTQLNRRSCPYKWKMTIARMPKVVMISAFHLVFVQSASNNFKLWWSQLSPRIHTDYTTTTTSTTITTTNYDDPSCLLIPLLTISSDPPSRQQPKHVHRRPFFPTHHFFSFFYFGFYKQKNANDLYIVGLYSQLPQTLLSLLSSHNFNWVFFYSLVAPPRGRKSKLALLLPQSPCHGTFLLPPGLR